LSAMCILVSPHDSSLCMVCTFKEAACLPCGRPPWSMIAGLMTSVCTQQVEKDRGITVKAQTATMFYEHEGEQYILNLIDTPGHVDFSYEVGRIAETNLGSLFVPLYFSHPASRFHSRGHFIPVWFTRFHSRFHSRGHVCFTAISFFLSSLMRLRRCREALQLAKVFCFS